MIETDHLDEVIAAAKTLAVAGVDGLDPESLGQVALGARRLRELADHLEVHALGALAETGHTEATTRMAAAGWFAREAGLPAAAGRTQVATARALRHLPGTDAAWLDGRISRDHVRVLCDAANPRIRDLIAALEPELIGIAEDRTFHHWRVRVGEVVARLDTEGRDPDDPAHTTATWARSGAFAELRARFAGADVELLEQIIEARTNQLFHQNIAERKLTADLPLLSRSQLRAQAIIDLLLHGPDGHVTAPSPDDGHDAHDDRTSTDLVPAIGTGGAPAPTDKIKTGNPLRVSISLVARRSAHTDRPGLPTLNADPSWTITNPDGRHLALEHIESLLCDCEAHALLVDDNDNPLTLGRSTRLATLKQRRAVIIRDGGCAHPGCDCPTGWVEIHHVRFWRNGGFTDVINLVALCRRHHGLTHRKGWSMHAADDGWFFWVTPTGDSYWSQRYGKQRTGPTPAQRHVAA